MIFRRNSLSSNKKSTSDSVTENLSAETIENLFSNMADFNKINLNTPGGNEYTLHFLKSLINVDQLNLTVILPLLHGNKGSVPLSIGSIEVTEIDTLHKAMENLLTGSILIEDIVQEKYWSIVIPRDLSRSIDTSQQESILYGPNDSFVEQIDQNITLIRRRLPIAQLKCKDFTIGSMSKTKLYLIYIDGLVDSEILITMEEKIRNIDYDVFLNTSDITSFLDDNKNSLFPQYQLSDRPDVIVSALSSGKISLILDGTPFVIAAPITFFELFQSPEDYVHRWLVGSFLRTIRFIAFLITLLLVPAYVAITTYNYEMLPLQSLIIVLTYRSDVPFNPVIEAFLMTLTLEILKEGSLRMPSKIAPSLGVVGGIVIGQAAIDSGIASPVLVVCVAISGLASFLVPNYLMTNSSKLIQFIFIGLAGLWGSFGIILGLLFLGIHLNSLTSLDRSYIAPLAPFYSKDWKDVIIRSPVQFMKTRPEYLQTQNKNRTSSTKENIK